MSESATAMGVPVQRHRVWRTALFLALVLGLIWADKEVFLNRSTPDRIAIDSLIEFTLERGKPSRVPAPALKYFGLPDDSERFLQIKAKSESSRTRAIQARKRESGAVDLFFVELLPHETKGYFYLASPRGRLIRAAYFDEGPEAIPDAQARFEEEIRFWRHWQSEKLKREVI